MEEKRPICHAEEFQIIHVDTLSPRRGSRLLAPEMWASQTDFLPKSKAEERGKGGKKLTVEKHDKPKSSWWTKVNISNDESCG